MQLGGMSLIMWTCASLGCAKQVDAPNADDNQGCGKLWYDGEAGSLTLTHGTTWVDPKPDPMKGSAMLSESTVEPHSGYAALEADLQWVAGYYGAAFGFNFAQYDAARAYDASNADSLEFWIRIDAGTKKHFLVWLTDSNRASSNKVAVASGAIPMLTMTWQRVSIPLATFANVDLTSIWEIDWDTHSEPFGTAGGIHVFIDDGVFTSADCHKG